MAGSLQYSFSQLSDKEWLQTGIAGLNDKMLGEYDLSTVARNITQFVAEYTGSQVAAFYLAESNSFLRYINGFAFTPNEGSNHISFGEGIAGQAAQTGKAIHLEDVPADLILISHATGAVKPNNIITIPVFFERSVAGVLELASIKAYTENELAYLQAISHNVGTVINSVQNRKKLQELLEETQSQSEELQAQHNELEI
jgi:GAF domain-containing protein